MATSAFGLRRRRGSSPQQCYLHWLHTLYIVSVRGYIFQTWCKQSIPLCRQIVMQTPHHTFLWARRSSQCPNSSIRALKATTNTQVTQVITSPSLPTPLEVMYLDASNHLIEQQFRSWLFEVTRRNQSVKQFTALHSATATFVLLLSIILVTDYIFFVFAQIYNSTGKRLITNEPFSCGVIFQTYFTVNFFGKISCNFPISPKIEGRGNESNHEILK